MPREPIWTPTLPSKVFLQHAQLALHHPVLLCCLFFWVIQSFNASVENLGLPCSSCPSSLCTMVAHVERPPSLRRAPWEPSRTVKMLLELYPYCETACCGTHFAFCGGCGGQRKASFARAHQAGPSTVRAPNHTFHQTMDSWDTLEFSGCSNSPLSCVCGELLRARPAEAEACGIGFPTTAPCSSPLHCAARPSPCWLDSLAVVLLLENAKMGLTLIVHARQRPRSSFTCFEA